MALVYDAAPEPPPGPAMTPADTFALAAKSGTTFYWKQPSGACDAWKIDGERLGTLERDDPKPAIELAFALDGNAVVLTGVSAKHALGEPPAAACKDRLTLGKDDETSFVVGDSFWYFSAEACAAGKPAPKTCAGAVSNVWRESAHDKDVLTKLMKSNGDVFVFDIHQGTPTCDRWQFAQYGRRLEQHTADGMTYYGATFAKGQLTLTGPNDVTKDGGSQGLGDMLQLAVEQVGADAYVVGGAAWFTDEEACERVRRGALVR